MTAATARNAFYAQSGGVTAVINTTACAVIETSRQHPDRIGRSLRRQERHHWRADRRPDLTPALKLRPMSPACGTRPVALSAVPLQAQGCRYASRAVRAPDRGFPRARFGYFFYNGGNDSMDTAWKVARFAEAAGYPLTCIGIPKTARQRPAAHRCPRVSGRSPIASPPRSAKVTFELPRWRLHRPGCS